MARLDYAEKMLKVCAMLSSGEKTAGVPNFYLSAWAHLNLAYLWKLLNDVRIAVENMLEMFIVDPFFSRIDFAPELWKSLFLPHMGSIVGWYSEERHRILMDAVPDSHDLSFTVDFDHYFNESLIASVRPDQAEKMQNLEKLYGQSLDENTRLYARYYKDCLNYDPATTKKGIPMMPIAEPPVTPLHELSRKIPDHVKFGPILPKSAGFSPLLRIKEDANKRIPEEEEDENEDEYDDGYQPDVKLIRNVKADSPYSPESRKSGARSSRTRTPVDSPRMKESSPKFDRYSKQMEQTSLLRLVSTRSKDASPRSADSDEMAERQISGKSSLRHSPRENQLLDKSFSNESDDGNHSCISLPLSEKLTPQSRPPKDSVCSITRYSMIQ